MEVRWVKSQCPIRAHPPQALKHVGRERWLMHARLEGLSPVEEGMKQWFTYIGWWLRQTSYVLVGTFHSERAKCQSCAYTLPIEVIECKRKSKGISDGRTRTWVWHEG